jgi:hypothetical protein
LKHEVNLLQYLPGFLRVFAEFREYAKIDTPEFEALWAAAQNLLKELFVATAETFGLERWERVLRLKPKKDDTPAERRFRILSKFEESPPYTLRSLHKTLTNLCGNGKYELTVDPGAYRIRLLVELVSKSNYRVAEGFVRRIAPANMEIFVSLRYNQWSALEDKIWAQAATKTWEEIRSEVLTWN